MVKMHHVVVYVLSRDHQVANQLGVGRNLVSQGIFYGTQSVGGVVNVVTKGFSNELDGNVGASVHSNDGYNVNGSVGNSIGKNQFVLFASYDDADGYQPFSDEDYQPSTIDRDRSYEVLTVGAKYAYNASDRSRVVLSYQFTDNQVDFARTQANVEAFNALGADDPERLSNWVDQQLNPTLADPEIDDRLQALLDSEVPADQLAYDTIEKAPEDLWVEHANHDDYATRNRPVWQMERLTLLRAAYSQWQLREVLYDFWFNHFNVYGREFPTYGMMPNYDAVLREHIFGNFGAMLKANARTATMLYYLDNYANTWPRPNENYAREVLELHTLGAVKNYYGAIDPASLDIDYGRNEIPRNGRVLLDNCNPDGATVDAEGYLWSAQWDDACIIRISPDGDIDRRIDFPGQVVSSVIFGGPKLDLIYVTTTGGDVHGVAPNVTQPGRVLVVSGAGYQGRAEPFFMG